VPPGGRRLGVPSDGGFIVCRAVPDAASVKISFRATPAEAARFKGAARLAGATPSQALRAAMAAYVQAVIAPESDEPAVRGRAVEDPAGEERSVARV
jgi:hypothetical protein